MPSPHTPPAWRRAFLRELARTGSVAAAARAVGIDRSSAYQARRRNAAFAASWARAVEAARESFETALRDGGCAASSGPPQDDPSRRALRQARDAPQDERKRGGGRSVLRLRADECVRASKDGRPCVVRAGPGRWSVRAERAFLDTLAATANVTAAAQAAGVSTMAAYKRRRQWPGFAAAWRAAQDEGWERIEGLLIQAATATLDPDGAAAGAGASGGAEAEPGMTVEQAMKLWFHHTGRASAGGRARRDGWRRGEPEIEEVRAEIARKLAAIRKARGAKGRGDGVDP